MALNVNREVEREEQKNHDTPSIRLLLLEEICGYGCRVDCLCLGVGSEEPSKPESELRDGTELTGRSGLFQSEDDCDLGKRLTK